MLNAQDDSWTTCPGDDELAEFVRICYSRPTYESLLKAIQMFLSNGLPSMKNSSETALLEMLERRPILNDVHILFTGTNLWSCVGLLPSYNALYLQVADLRRSMPNSHGLWVVDESSENSLASKMASFVGRVENLRSNGA